MMKRIGFALGATLCLTLTTSAAEAPRMEGGYAFRPDLTVGGADADDDHFFYEKYGSVEVGADAQGRIYVLDNGNARIQVFGKDGELVHSLGSEGDGPGEFRIPSRLAVNSAGDFAIFDMGQGRVSVFDASGELLRDQLISAGVADLALGDDRTVYIGYGKYGPAQVEAYGPDGKLAWSAGEGTPSPGRMINIEIGMQTIAPRLAILEGGAFVRAPKGDYEVQAWAAGGRERGTWVRTLERRAFSDEELAPPGGDEDGEGATQEVIIVRRGPGESGGHGGGGAGGGMADAQSWSDSEGETMTFDTESLKQYMPTHHSATRGVLAFADGRVWVLTSELDGGGNVVDEWSADGTWERRFVLSSDYDWVCLGRDGRVYAVTHDEDDYPSVHRLVVEAGA